MLDPALIDALTHAIRPPAAIIQPAAELGESMPHFRKRLLAEVEAVEATTSSWLAEGEHIRRRFSERLAWFAKHHVISDNDPRTIDDADIVAVLDRMIATIEEVCRAAAVEFDERERSFRRQIKRARMLGLAEVSLFEEVAERAMRTAQSELEERSDFVLFLRALRSEFSPGGHDGPAFDDPDALDRFLREAVA